MSRKWNNQQTAKFVNMYKEQENLWNKYSPDYKNRNVRMASLQYIVREMGIPNFSVKDVVKKITSLRSTYQQEILKTKRKARGAGANNVYKSKLKWFNTMDYIMKNSNIKEKEISSNLSCQHDKIIQCDQLYFWRYNRPNLIFSCSIVEKKDSIEIKYNMERIINILFDEYDECHEYFQENRRRSRLIRSRINYLEMYDEVSFKERFVISRHSFMRLLERIQGEIQHKTDRNNAIPPSIQLMVTLRFYATGSFLKTMDNFCAISEELDKDSEVKASEQGNSHNPEIDFDDDSNNFVLRVSPVDTYVDTPVDISSTRTIKRNPPKRSKISSITTAEHELQNLNKSLSVPIETPRKEEDECDIMGKHITIQLRQLPVSDMIQANVEIQQILMKYRLRNIYD